jgi:hypothetical protein
MGNLESTPPMASAAGPIGVEVQADALSFAGAGTPRSTKPTKVDRSRRDPCRVGPSPAPGDAIHLDALPFAVIRHPGSALDAPGALAGERVTVVSSVFAYPVNAHPAAPPFVRRRGARRDRASNPERGRFAPASPPFAEVGAQGPDVARRWGGDLGLYVDLQRLPAATREERRPNEHRAARVAEEGQPAVA